MLKERLPALAVGTLFGVLFAFYEMIGGYIPMVWRWTPTRVFGEEFLITTAFHAVFFSVVALPTIFFPRRFRRIGWLCIYYLVTVAVITFMGSQRVEVIVGLVFVSAICALATIYGAIKLWRSGGRVRRFGVVSACLIMGMIPFALIAFGSKVPQASEPSSYKTVQGKPNVLFIIYDAVNHGHMPAFGYKRNTAPNFDGIARDGVLFEKFYVTANWTVPVHGSMFTGRFSKAHGATHEHPYLAGSEYTLAEHLESYGYQTAGFSCNPWVGSGTGFDQGFQVFKEMWRGFYRDEVWLLHRFWAVYFNQKKDKGGALLVREVKDWAAGADHQRPYFMFLNLMEAHTPYHQLPDKYAYMYMKGKPTRSELALVGSNSLALQLCWRSDPVGKRELETAKALYDGGIYYDDVITGEVLDILESKGLLNNTIVIIASDHGELFGEHGMYGHEVSLYEPLTHVFMAMSWKGNIKKGLELDTPVSANDLLPTLHELMGLDGRLPATLHGRSVVPLIEGEEMGESLRVAETYIPKHLHTAWKYNQPLQDTPDIINQRWLALWEGDLKYIRVNDSNDQVVEEMLFDISKDPGEMENIKGTRPEDLRRLQKLLDDWQENVGSQASICDSSVPPLDEETKDRLHHLGYIGSEE